MFNATEKEELKRIISKYIEKGCCTRPKHPDEVLREINRFNQAEALVEPVASNGVIPTAAPS